MKLLDAMNEYLGKVKKTDAKVCCALVATTDAAMTGDKLPDSRNYRLVAPRADVRLFQTEAMCEAKIKDLEQRGNKEEIKKWEEIIKIADSVPTGY